MHLSRYLAPSKSTLPNAVCELNLACSLKLTLPQRVGACSIEISFPTPPLPRHAFRKIQAVFVRILENKHPADQQGEWFAALGTQ